ncbi:MAG: hypothetical protein LBE49_05480, partial [Deltaproteobacteria bacterium]|nr:hypothetical protein [Deltaproteobacteria bacterium]
MEPMKQSLSYINSFFDDFLKDSSIEGAFYLKISLNEFLEHETKEKALAVFTCFFDCFRIHLEGRNFVDLLDALNAYEENSSVLLDKQRDHLIHSVNVFVLGLSVFAKNEHYARAFQTARVYPYNGALNSPSEEFLFRWGLAALLHDIGYPVEIINNQFKAFIKFIGESDGKKGADPFLDYFNFSAIDSIDEILYKSVFAKNFMKAIPSGIELDPLKPTHLLAYNFHTSLGVSFGEIRDKVMGFLPTMQKFGFVDHGYYSSLILLKWYGTLIQRTGLSPDVFYHPVLDSAGAIFLHNYYRNGIMKPPFSLGALSASSHPIAFLLILCDELQEWNRKAYGAL